MADVLPHTENAERIGIMYGESSYLENQQS